MYLCLGHIANFIFMMVQDALAAVNWVVDKIQESIQYVKSTQTVQKKNY